MHMFKYQHACSLKLYGNVDCAQITGIALPVYSMTLRMSITVHLHHGNKSSLQIENSNNHSKNNITYSFGDILMLILVSFSSYPRCPLIF